MKIILFVNALVAAALLTLTGCESGTHSGSTSGSGSATASGGGSFSGGGSVTTR